jgi:TRAP-type mannitol/chloroaromatic compound transport system permease small subunit
MVAGTATGQESRRSRSEKFIAAVGKGAAWLTLAMVCLTFFVVVMRYGLNQGWIWMQESVTYLHAAVFMLAAAWTLQVDGHVRVDIFYRVAPPRRKALVDLAGIVLFLAPFCIYLLLIGWEYVAASWKLLEGSRESGGLPLVYILKSFILALPALLLLQAYCSARQALRVLRDT